MDMAERTSERAKDRRMVTVTGQVATKRYFRSSLCIYCMSTIAMYEVMDRGWVYWRGDDMCLCGRRVVLLIHGRSFQQR